MTGSARCVGHTSCCIVLPAKPYRRWPGNAPLSLCAPCAAELRSMGLGLEEEDGRPEWVQRAQSNRLPAKEMTGAAR